MYRFQGEDNDLVCNLGRVCLDANVNYETMQTIANYYGIEIDVLETEHRLFKKFLESHENIVIKTASDATEVLYENQLFDLLPVNSKLASIFASIPASSATAERSFSTLRRLKTYLRSTMGQNRVSSLAILNIERVYTNLVLSESMDLIIDTFGR